MLDLANIPLSELLGFGAAVTPIAILAALAVTDLRALMLLRAAKLSNRRLRPGETRVSGDEWSPTPIHV